MNSADQWAWVKPANTANSSAQRSGSAQGSRRSAVLCEIFRPNSGR